MRIPSEAVVGDPFEITEMMQRRNERTAAQTIVMRGVAKTYLPFVGRIIEVLLPDSMDVLQSWERIKLSKLYTVLTKTIDIPTHLREPLFR